ncbi:MAG: SGNH/GDSL hydrolase family protein [Armatimonadota bacterium]|nr:SGNH/GDSL hydrolase family protein [Armatimonadota bacterium]
MRMQWIEFPDSRLVVNGLPWWEETRPKLIRLPERYRDRVREPVWNLAHSPSGARIRFATDSTALSIRAHFPHLNHMNNMPRTGQLGIDVWGDGDFWRPVFPPGDDHDLEEVVFEDHPPQRREICLYLGLYGPVEVQAIGLSGGAAIEPPAPFALERPVVYYGSSITQGGCASHAGMSYQAIVSRRLNLDFVNLGFSGNGRGEPELAEAMAEIDASCYVIDFCQNCPTLEELEVRYAPFLARIRQDRPETPIICVTAIFSTHEVIAPTSGRHDGMRAIIRAAVEQRQAMGDGNISLVEGYEMLGPDDRDGLVDQSHPSDMGFTSMADGLEPHLRAALGL